MWSLWRTLVVVGTPVLLLPLLLTGDEENTAARCGFMLLLVSVYWITESLPLAVTSLLTVALCPLLGIMSSKDAAKSVFGDVTFLMIGGMLVSIAIEESRLHQRFALKILMVIGVQPTRLILGLMLTTAFLSMWISNTATTAMMVPITRALLAKLFQSQREMEARGGTGGEAGEALLQTQASKNHVTDIGNDVISLDPSNNMADIGGADQEGNLNSSCDVELVPREQKKGSETPDVEKDDEILANLSPESLRVVKVFSLCICYSANVGGVATLTGTPTNLVLATTVQELSSGAFSLTFARWFLFGLPCSALILLLCYLWMKIYAFGLWNTVSCKSQASQEEVAHLREIVAREHASLGTMKFGEKVVLVHFILLVILWLTRQPGSFPGWSILFEKGFVTDGTTAMVLGLSLFLFPRQRPNVLCFRAKGDTSAATSTPAILTWKSMSSKFPWGTMLLLGAGMILANASKVSGLSNAIAGQLYFLKDLPKWLTSVLVAFMTSLATELTSNMAICMLVLPILADVAANMAVNPLYLMLPTTVASSLAFMLPIATPPNAIVFNYGDIKVLDMIKCGFVLNILGVAVVALATNTWGSAIFDLDTIPHWAAGSNLTSPGNRTLASNNTERMSL